MRIVKVRIQNFKVYKDKIFEFPNEKVVLLTGGNGFGKTTLIDAIEWCLTGNIGRVSNCYSERYSQKTEKNRKENRAGIIKNSECAKQDFVKVSLVLKFGDEMIEVYRRQIEDDLFIKSKLEFNTEISEEKKKIIINAINNDKFYKYHLCDSYKTYNFLMCNRQEIKERFDEFISDRPKIKMFKKNLELVKSYSQNKIDKLKEKKIADEIIKDKDEKLSEMKKKTYNIEYPKKKFYDNENINISNENNKKIELQLEQVMKCGYNIMYNKIDNIISWYEAKEKEDLFLEVFNIISNKKDDIDIVLKNKFYDENLKKELLSKKKKIIDKKNKVKYISEIKDIIDLNLVDEYPETKEYIDESNRYIKDLKKEIESLNNQIEDKEKGNDIIKALSDLVANRNALFIYRKNGNYRCPLCGSDSKFKDISYEDLAKDSIEYLKKSKTTLSELKIKVKKNEDYIQRKMLELKKQVLIIIDINLKKVEEKISKYNLYCKEMHDFFEKIKYLGLKIDDKLIKNCQIAHSMNRKILLNNKVSEFNLQLIRKFLIFIEYSEQLNEVNSNILKKIKLELNNFYDNNLNVLEFNFEDFTKKIIYMKNIINNSEINKIEKIINQYNETNKKIDKRINKLNNYIIKANELLGEINKLNIELEKKELTTVAPYLFKIFTKFIKHCKVGGFQLNRDNSKKGGGATFSDDSGNNILNTLSEGQMGIFILSYFFANMFRRSSDTIFKVYFIDDITSCMDDINVLSFIEVIKYQISSDDSVINQVFFSTCDYNLENLFIHKMKSFGIKVADYKFISYGNAMKVE